MVNKPTFVKLVIITHARLLSLAGVIGFQAFANFLQKYISNNGSACDLEWPYANCKTKVASGGSAIYTFLQIYLCIESTVSLSPATESTNKKQQHDIRESNDLFGFVASVSASSKKNSEIIFNEKCQFIHMLIALANAYQLCMLFCHNAPAIQSKSTFKKQKKSLKPSPNWEWGEDRTFQFNRSHSQHYLQIIQIKWYSTLS